MLRHRLRTRIFADTLDWDVLALMHRNFDASMLSLDDVYKGLVRDKETYYFLWVAVRKVLAEAPPPKTLFSGARVTADQKTQYLNELLDATLEQLVSFPYFVTQVAPPLAELGDAQMNFVEGAHCTIVDPRMADDSHAIRAKARSLVARFEKLGRSRDMLMVAIPATEAGIDAAARLQREDGINVNLTSVSGVVHATACAQAGAVAVTLPIAKLREWRRYIRRDIIADSGQNSGTGGEDAETIAAHFELHGFSSTGLIAAKMDHVDDACPLAVLMALSFDADQAKKAEWYDAYPKMPPLALPEYAVRRARAFPPPPPADADVDANDDASTSTNRTRSTNWSRTMERMNARTFSAFAAITSGAVGSAIAVMEAIADIARDEIDWQIYIMQPLSAHTAAPAPRHHHQHYNHLSGGSARTCGSRASTTRTQMPAAGAAVTASATHHDQRPGKRRRSPVPAAAEDEVLAGDTHPAPPEKRARRGSQSQGYCHRATASSAAASSAGRRSTELDAERKGEGEGRRAASRLHATPLLSPSLQEAERALFAAISRVQNANASGSGSGAGGGTSHSKTTTTTGSSGSRIRKGDGGGGGKKKKKKKTVLN
ncbi:hypothetical protein BJV74DRAFT_886819 [Russula compacta]|nr:hypothetical protein BJV74DRAFT_886819 [Russula compacta]